MLPSVTSYYTLVNFIMSSCAYRVTLYATCVVSRHSKLAYTKIMTKQDGSRQRAGFSWRFELGLAQQFDADGCCWFDKSNRELGLLFHVSKKTITNWRKNDIFPGVETCVRICDLLAISIEWLLTGYGQPDRAPQLPIDKQWLNEMYDTMNSEDKTRVLNDMFQGYNNTDVKTVNNTKHQRVLQLVASTRDQTST